MKHHAPVKSQPKEAVVGFTLRVRQVDCTYQRELLVNYGLALVGDIDFVISSGECGVRKKPRKKTAKKVPKKKVARKSVRHAPTKRGKRLVRKSSKSRQPARKRSKRGPQNARQSRLSNPLGRQSSKPRVRKHPARRRPAKSNRRATVAAGARYSIARPVDVLPSTKSSSTRTMFSNLRQADAEGAALVDFFQKSAKVNAGRPSKA